MARETTYSDKFLDHFKRLYAKWGRDIDCLEELRTEWMWQYPHLTVNTLAKIRNNPTRKEEFKKAKEDHIHEVAQIQREEERRILIRARDLNTKTVEILERAQERFLQEADLLDPDEEDFLPKLNTLLGNITAVQERINKFSGLDLMTHLDIFKQKLLAKKLVDEKSVDDIIKMFQGGDTIGGFTLETKSDGPPKLTWNKEEDNGND